MRRETMYYTLPRYCSGSYTWRMKNANTCPSFFARPQLKRVSYARAYMRGIRPGLGGAGREQQNARRIIPRDLYSNKLFV